MRAASVVAVVAVLTVSSVRAEVTVAVRGRVVTLDGDAIAGASISAGNATAIADREGRFVLEGVSPGSAGVLVVADGYLPAVVTVTEAERPAAVIALTPDTDAPDDLTGEVIEVSGEAPDTGQSTRYALSTEQIRALPGAGNDALRALQSMPGVARTAYGLGGIILRGADPQDSRVYLDGIEVPLAFHVGGVTSFYPSALLESVVITPGGGDVALGRSVGGVVEMTSRAPRGDRLRVGAEASLLDASLHAEGATFAGGAVAIGLRRSYIDAILAEALPPDDRFLPRYHDAQVRWDQPLGRGVLTVLGFFSDDGLRNGDELDVRQSFVRTGLRYRRSSGGTTVSALGWIGLRRLAMRAGAGLEAPSSVPNGNEDGDDDDDGLDDPFLMDLAMMPLGGRADVRRDTDWGHVSAGLDAEIDTRQSLTVEGADDLGAMGVPADEQAARLPPASGELAAWAEARWRIADGRLTVKPGARVEHLTASDEWLLEPRVVVSHELGRVTLRESLGVHHQPAAVGQTRSHVEGDRRLFARPPAARAVHASLGADLALPAQVRASVTAYQASVAGPPIAPAMPGERDGQLTLDDGLEALFGVVIANLAGNELGNDDGRFRSRGIELMLRRETDRSLLWLSYTLSRSEHHTGPIDGARWIPTALDQTHNLGAVASVRLGRWRLGARMRYATGVPYTPKSFVRDEVGDWRPRLGPARSQRLPDFVSLDLRIDRAWPRSWGTIAAFVEAWNATNAHNVEAVVIDRDGEHFLPGLPVLPMLGLSYAPR